MKLCTAEPGRAPRTSLNTLKVACAASLLERTTRSSSGYTLTTGTSLGPSSTTVRAIGGPEEGYLLPSSAHSDHTLQHSRMLLAAVDKGPCSGRAIDVFSGRFNTFPTLSPVGCPRLLFTYQAPHCSNK